MIASLPLFDAVPDGPTGLLLDTDIVSSHEEQALIARFADLPFEPFAFHGFKGNRRTVAYGSRYDFTRGRVIPAEAIPDWLLPLRDRAARSAGLPAADFVQALVIDYPPGAGIGWHRDRPDYGVVTGVSFGSSAVLRLRRRKASGWDRHATPIAPRSVYVLRDEVRDVWEHSIAPGKIQRWSVTFRTLR